MVLNCIILYTSFRVFSQICLLIYILEHFKNASSYNVRYFDNSSCLVMKYDYILLEIVNLIKLKKLQKFMSCMMTFAPVDILLILFNTSFSYNP